MVEVVVDSQEVCGLSLNFMSSEVTSYAPRRAHRNVLNKFQFREFHYHISCYTPAFCLGIYCNKLIVYCANLCNVENRLRRCLIHVSRWSRTAGEQQTKAKWSRVCCGLWPVSPWGPQSDAHAD